MKKADRIAVKPKSADMSNGPIRSIFFADFSLDLKVQQCWCV